MTQNGGGFKLVGAQQFVRHNPHSDKFNVQRFHSVEFWCADATNTYKRWVRGGEFCVTAVFSGVEGEELPQLLYTLLVSPLHNQPL